jgi:hypothetical protein
MKRNLSQEANLWYTLTSPDFFESAKAHLQFAHAAFQAAMDAEPQAASYAPLPTLGSELDLLLQAHANAKAMLQQGSFAGVIAWQGQLERLPRAFEERSLAWMGSMADPFMNELELANSVAYRAWLALVMSQMYCDPAFKDQSADWHVDVPEDMGLSGDDISRYIEEHVLTVLPALIPEYAADTSVSCKTGDIVPWTGVWVPSTGMGTAALAFARQGVQIMQPAYEVASVDEDGSPDGFHLVDCIWYPVKPTGRMIEHPLFSTLKYEAAGARGRCEAGQRCPREGWWFTPAAQDSRRVFKLGEVMPSLKADYGHTIWQWDASQ